MIPHVHVCTQTMISLYGNICRRRQRTAATSTGQLRVGITLFWLQTVKRGNKLRIQAPIALSDLIDETSDRESVKTSIRLTALLLIYEYFKFVKYSGIIDINIDIYRDGIIAIKAAYCPIGNGIVLITIIITILQIDVSMSPTRCDADY